MVNQTSRLDTHEHQILQLQTDVAEIKASLLALNDERAESAEFRKVVLNWMKSQEKRPVDDSSGASGLVFSTSGVNSSSSDPSSGLPWAVKKVKLPEFSGFDPQVAADPSHASAFSRVLQGQESSTSRVLFGESNESDSCGRPIQWPSSLTIDANDKIDPASISQHYSTMDKVSFGRPTESFFTNLLSGPDLVASKASLSLFRYQHSSGPLTGDGPQVLGQGEPKRVHTPKITERRHPVCSFDSIRIKCVAAKGDDASECEKFAKFYRSLCPGEWVDRWNEQRENGIFPGPL
ncbi:hypothetical protein E3N88_28691 [Mikania micrantha]|uniref:Cytochrome c oxidase subunit 6b n=1 Tax=Mikania micrantha TaxID=192012 RepID=A0A5N6N1D7_9ASTR|nr:hypothetical protein E3N88_28691 [Mikania micrantha]